MDACYYLLGKYALLGFGSVRRFERNGIDCIVFVRSVRRAEGEVPLLKAEYSFVSVYGAVPSETPVATLSPISGATGTPVALRNVLYESVSTILHTPGVCALRRGDDGNWYIGSSYDVVTRTYTHYALLSGDELFNTIGTQALTPEFRAQNTLGCVVFSLSEMDPELLAAMTGDAPQTVNSLAWALRFAEQVTLARALEADRESADDRTSSVGSSANAAAIPARERRSQEKISWGAVGGSAADQPAWPDRWWDGGPVLHLVNKTIHGFAGGGGGAAAGGRVAGNMCNHQGCACLLAPADGEAVCDCEGHLHHTRLSDYGETSPLTVLIPVLPLLTCLCQPAGNACVHKGCPCESPRGCTCGDHHHLQHQSQKSESARCTLPTAHPYGNRPCVLQLDPLCRQQLRAYWMRMQDGCVPPLHLF